MTLKRQDESTGAWVYRMAYFDGAYVGRLPIEEIFLYGPLAEPEVLKQVVGLEEEPVLEDAYVSRLIMRMWGQQPALVLTNLASDLMTYNASRRIVVDSQPPKIEGKVWYAPHPKYQKKLAEYLGDNYFLYRTAFTTIGKEGVKHNCNGMTFVWWGDMSELMDEKGNRVVGFG